MISFACPQCGKSLRAPESKSGAPTNCPQCGADIRVPALSAASPVVATAEEVAAPAAPAPAAAPASPWWRFVKLVFALIVMVVVLAASVWGGMVWRAGGVANAPRSLSEFWSRLLQKPVEKGE